MSRRLILLLTIAVVAALALPAAAITDGDADLNGDYPFVGMLLFYVPDEIDPRFGEADPGAWFSCTGTYIGDNVVLTAGHCTYGIGFDDPNTNPGNLVVPPPLGDGGNAVWVNFQARPDLVDFPPSTDYYENEDDDLTVANGNQSRYDDRETWLDAHSQWIRGVAHPNPDYSDALFLLHDSGVVVLNPAQGETVPNESAVVAPAGAMDQYVANVLEPGIGQKKSQDRFTAVGYGYRSLVPVVEPDPNDANEVDERFYADGLMLIDATGQLGLAPLVPGDAAVLLFSNSPGAAHTGGTCFGDSGGPIFSQEADGSIDELVAVTSFGLNPNCVGNGGGYRIDQDPDLEFICEYVELPVCPAPQPVEASDSDTPETAPTKGNKPTESPSKGNKPDNGPKASGPAML